MPQNKLKKIYLNFIRCLFSVTSTQDYNFTKYHIVLLLCISDCTNKLIKEIIP